MKLRAPELLLAASLSNSDGRRLPQICAATAGGIALLALIGWQLHARFLGGQWGANIPMAPSTALAFLFLGGALFSYARWQVQVFSRRFAMAAVSLVFLLGLLVLGQFITGIDLGVEQALSRTNESLGQAPLGRMSPLTAISFLLESAALVFLLITQRGRYAPTAAALLAAGATAINLVVLLGYAYGAPLLYGGTFIPVALPTAFAFVLVGVGQINLATPALPALRAWSGASMRGRLLRAFLPSVLVLILIVFRLDHIFDQSLLMNQTLWRALIVLAAAVLVVAIIGWIAGRTGAAIEQAEESLRKTKEDFRRSLDDSPMGIRIFMPDGMTVYANRLFLDLFGCDSLEEFNATPPEKRYTPESYGKYKQRKERRKRDDFVPPGYEISIVRKNGESRHLEVFLKELLWNGEPHFQHLCHDVTERKQAEEALRRSEENFRRSLDDSPMGIRIMTADGETIYANRAMLDLYGYASVEEFATTPIKKRYT
ncbi:MAG: PAS domain S-box protein, partial [Dehalococcoidia bacterium]|nr:PAS domain S-box protein [Dehalococcoidia bacterium]